jgi:Cu-Zn family superoxide dismutase
MLVANAKGVARFEAVMDGLTLTPGPANILNRSIVVHALPDDYTTQPSGNTGPSVSCGIILMKP